MSAQMDGAYSPFHAVYDVKHGHCSLCAELPEIPGSITTAATSAVTLPVVYRLWELAVWWKYQHNSKSHFCLSKEKRNGGDFCQVSEDERHAEGRSASDKSWEQNAS